MFTFCTFPSYLAKDQKQSCMNYAGAQNFSVYTSQTISFKEQPLICTLVFYDNEVMSYKDVVPCNS